MSKKSETAKQTPVADRINGGLIEEKETIEAEENVEKILGIPGIDAAIESEISLLKTAPAPVERQRQTKTAIACPRCKENACRVVETRGYPAFLSARMRRYKCAACNYTFKNA